MASQTETIQKPMGLLQWISLALVVVMVLLSGWAYVQKSKVNKAIAATSVEINQAQKQLDEIREEQVDSIVLAQQTMERIEASAIVWSEVITDLISVTPLDIFYRSYNAASDGAMSVNVLTDSYDSGAQLISILDDEDEFTNVFVSSLTQGSSSGGGEGDVVSFGITFNVN